VAFFWSDARMRRVIRWEHRKGERRVEFLSGEFLGLVPGVILAIVAMGLVAEAIDERKVMRQVGSIPAPEPAGNGVLRPLAEAA